ncbi:MAG: 4Fe-4S dicluster domain-containing protein [Bacteroidota bacterium]
MDTRLPEELPARTGPSQEGRETRFVRLEAEHLGVLVNCLFEDGFEVVGPVRKDHAIVFMPIQSAGELARGWVDEQDSAAYRIKRSGEQWFGFSSSPSSWKRFLFPPSLKLFRSSMTKESATLEEPARTTKPYAFLGLRPCDLEAIKIQDKVFLEGGYPDSWYSDARRTLFTIVVSCAKPGGTCFCNSMNTGPKASVGFDIQMTELDQFFLAEAGTDRGSAMLARVPHRPATAAEVQQAEAQHEAASHAMGRTLETAGLKEILPNRHSDHHWETIGKRCLGCANCTMVCPTCFCFTVDDTISLSGNEAERTRRWDSCFTSEFSYIHGGSVRSTVHARYRHWMTHKLATWVDQFGTMGCVGCGRCITWCPVGIDLTEEASIFRKRAEAQSLS